MNFPTEIPWKFRRFVCCECVTKGWVSCNAIVMPHRANSGGTFSKPRYEGGMNTEEVPNQALPTLAAWAMSPPAWDEICNPTMMRYIAADVGDADYYMADPICAEPEGWYGPNAVLIVLRNVRLGVDQVCMLDEDFDYHPNLATKFAEVQAGGEPLSCGDNPRGFVVGTWVPWIDGDHDF